MTFCKHSVWCAIMATHSRPAHVPRALVTSSDAEASPSKRTNLADFAHGAWVLRCVEKAQMDVMAQKEALYVTKLDRSQWHAGLLGLAHLSILRLALMPETFWKALFHHVAAHYGWELAVMQRISQPETPSQEVKRLRATAAQTFIGILKYAEVGASTLERAGEQK
jgi:hypothetical protein